MKDNILKRIKIAYYIVLAVFVILMMRLWQIQILQGKEYREIDKQNRIRILSIPASRGVIFDRNGVPLVKNIPTFDLTVRKEDLNKRPEYLKKLGMLIGMEVDYLKSRLKKNHGQPFIPLVIKKDISFKEVAKIEARKLDIPGVQVNVVEGREYVFGTSTAHLLGYIGVEEKRSFPVVSEPFVGKSGIEKIYDHVLRGMPGRKVIEVNASGDIIRTVRIYRPLRGRDIDLTIDINLQIEADRAMKGKSGAIVAMNPKNGEILALYSAPSFNPNLFSRGISEKEWNRLLNDPRRPLINRTIQSTYAPGSTFKIVTAIAGLAEGIITGRTRYYCSGGLYLGRLFRCWKSEGHGSVDLYRAIVESCDVYFYEIGKRIDIDTLAQYAFDLGLGRKTGIELEGESTGIVPTTKWKRTATGQEWYKGETLNTAIGQGYLSVTPLQMARLMSAIVNGGKLYKPYLIRRYGDDTEPENILRIRQEYLQMIKDALVGVVEEKNGTGYLARSEIVSIGGKTGTTQVIGVDEDVKEVPEQYRDHAWFVAYAPVNDPEIVVVVFVEHGGHGSTGAAPIAKRIIETYFEGHPRKSIL